MSSGWQTTRLGEIVNFKTGKLDSNAAVSDGDYPFFTCSQETLRTNSYSFDTECVLLAGNNANGVYPLKYFKGKFDAYQRTYVVTPRDTNKLMTRFLYYALRPKLEQFRAISTGAATKFLTLTILNQTEVQVPSLPAQRRIAGILSAYDDLIENNTRRIKILEEMSRALYREWFVYFRFPGHEKIKFVDSSLGKIPKGWEVHNIGNVVETLGGGTPSTNNSDFWDNGEVTWFTPSDLTAGRTMFITTSGKKISRLGLERSSARLFPAYSVMMTSRATIGVVAINTTQACTNQGFITCIPNDRLSTAQIYFWIMENLQKIIGIASGATYKEINRTEFRELPITVANKLLNEKFSSLVEPILKQIEVLQLQTKNLRRTRDLLLPRLLSGQITL